VIGSALTDKLPTNYGSPAGQQPTYGGSDDQPNYNDQPTYGNELSADEQVGWIFNNDNLAQFWLRRC